MYIANLFQNLQGTDEVNKAKDELLTMMEDKYNELKAHGRSENEAIGIVISEFGNIDELKEELGLSSVLNKDNGDYSSVNLKKKEPARNISMDETKNFLKNSYEFSTKISIGVVLCIISVIPLIVLNGFTKGTSTVISSNTADALGITIMFIVVAIAVALFIIGGLKHQKYNYMKMKKIELDYNTTEYIKDLKESFKTTFASKITVGVILCIVSVIPVVITDLLFKNSNGGIETMSIGLMFIVVALAVMLFITAGIKMNSYKILLQEGEYSLESKENNERIGKVAAIYWPFIVVVYLVWSFVKMDWAISWIIWPIAGVLFAVIAGICNLSAQSKKGI